LIIRASAHFAKGRKDDSGRVVRTWRGDWSSTTAAIFRWHPSGFDRNEQGRSPSDQFDGREGLSDDYG
jgi:hypothetical protein